MDFDDDKHPNAQPPAKMRSVEGCETTDLIRITRNAERHAVYLARYLFALTPHCTPDDMAAISRVAESRSTTEAKRAMRKLTERGVAFIRSATRQACAEFNANSGARELGRRGVDYSPYEKE